MTPPIGTAITVVDPVLAEHPQGRRMTPLIGTAITVVDPVLAEHPRGAG